MSLYLARRGAGGEEDAGFWDDVEFRYQTVELVFDRLQAVCRPMPLSAVRLPLALLIEDRVEAWNDRLASSGRRLILHPPAEPAVGIFDPVLFGRGFDDLVQWRSIVGAARSDLRIRWAVEEGEFHVVWDEPTHKRTPSATSDAPAASPLTFAPLTIALLTRIVVVHGGRIEPAERGRWRLELRWPIDARFLQEEAPKCSASHP